MRKRIYDQDKKCAIAFVASMRFGIGKYMEQTLADRVRQRMKTLDISQEKLGDACGVSQSQLSRLLKGKVERPSYIWELSKNLSKSVRWLLTGEDEQYEEYIEFTLKNRGFISLFEQAEENTRKSILLQLGIGETDKSSSEPKKKRDTHGKVA